MIGFHIADLYFPRDYLCTTYEVILANSGIIRRIHKIGVFHSSYGLCSVMVNDVSFSFLNWIHEKSQITEEYMNKHEANTSKPKYG